MASNFQLPADTQARLSMLADVHRHEMGGPEKNGRDKAWSTSRDCRTDGRIGGDDYCRVSGLSLIPDGELLCFQNDRASRVTRSPDRGPSSPVFPRKDFCSLTQDWNVKLDG